MGPQFDWMVPSGEKLIKEKAPKDQDEVNWTVVLIKPCSNGAFFISETSLFPIQTWKFSKHWDKM